MHIFDENTPLTLEAAVQVCGKTDIQEGFDCFKQTGNNSYLPVVNGKLCKVLKTLNIRWISFISRISLLFAKTRSVVNTILNVIKNEYLIRGSSHKLITPRIQPYKFLFQSSSIGHTLKTSEEIIEEKIKKPSLSHTLIIVE